MIKQVLRYIASAIETPLPEELLKLTASLQDLPVLATLIPSPFELREVIKGVDIDDIMGRLAMLLQGEVGDEDEIREVVKEGFTTQAAAEVAASTPTSTSGKKRKRKKKKGKGKGGGGVGKGEGDGGNMFQVLA